MSVRSMLSPALPVIPRTPGEVELVRLRAENEALKRKNMQLEKEIADRDRTEGVYRFTKEELKAHDQVVGQAAFELRRKQAEKNMYVQMSENYKQQLTMWEEDTTRFWNKAKEEFKGGDEEENFLEWCKVMWAIPIYVLVHKFKWKKVDDNSCGDSRQALVRFCKECVNVAIRVTQDEKKDIRTFCKEVAAECGAGFIMEE